MRHGKKLKPKKKKQLFEFRGFQVYVEKFIVNELSYQRIYPLEVISTIIFDYNQYSRNETTIPIFKFDEIVLPIGVSNPAMLSILASRYVQYIYLPRRKTITTLPSMSEVKGWSRMSTSKSFQM